MLRRRPARQGSETAPAVRNALLVTVAALLMATGLLACSIPLFAFAEDGAATAAFDGGGAAAPGDEDLGGEASQAGETDAPISLVALDDDVPVVGVAAYDLADYLVKDGSNLTVGGVALIQNGEVVQGAQVTNDQVVTVGLELTWRIPNDVVVTSGTAFTYRLPDSVDLDGVGGNLVDGAGNVLGSYKVSGGVLTVAYTSGMGSDVEGGVKINGRLSNKSEGAQNDLAFEGLGTVSFLLQRDDSSDGLKIRKYCYENVDGNVLRQRWVVAVVATGDNGNVVVKDQMGENLSIEGGSLAVYTDSTLQTAYTGAYQTNVYGDSRGFSVAFDGLADEAVYIAYLVDVGERAAFDTVGEHNKNTATATSDLLAEAVRAEGWVSVWNTGWTVQKSGVVNEDGSATWTVVLDTGGADDIAGTVVGDALGSGLTAPTGGVLVQESSDGAAWTDSAVAATWDELAAGSFTFPAGSTSRYYRIVYTTGLTDLPVVGTKTYGNTVTVKPYGAGGALSAPGSVTAGAAVSVVQKTCETVSGASTAIDWKVVVSAPEGADLTGVKLSDGLPAGLEYDGDVTVKTADGAAYGGCTVAFTKDWQGTVTGFEVTFANDVLPAGTELLVTYTTTICDPTAYSGSHTFANTAAIEANELASSVSSKASYTYLMPTFCKSAWSSSASFTGTLKWTVTLGADVVSLNPDATTFTVVDDLPANTCYVEGSLAAWKDWNVSATYDGVTAQVLNGGEQVVFTVAGAALEVLKNGGELEFAYETKVVDPALCTVSDTYVNTASLVVDGQTEVTSDAQVTKGKPSVLDKSAVYDATTAPIASYTIAVNPSGLDLNASGDVLVLTDIMGTGLDLRPASIKVSVGGEEAVAIGQLADQGFSYAYDAAVRTLTVTVPDGMPCTVTYDVLVTLDAGTTFTSANAGNTATLADACYDGSTFDLAGTALESSGWTTSTGCRLVVYKYAAGDMSVTLAGATYTVEILSFEKDGSTWTVTSTETAVRDVTSGDDGYTPVVGGLRTDTVYRVTETEAPVGYTVGSPLYVVFPGGDGVDYTGVAIVDDGAAVDLVVASSSMYTWYEPNEKKPSRIPALNLQPAAPVTPGDPDEEKKDADVKNDEDKDEDKDKGEDEDDNKDKGDNGGIDDDDGGTDEADDGDDADGAGEDDAVDGDAQTPADAKGPETAATPVAGAGQENGKAEEAGKVEKVEEAGQPAAAEQLAAQGGQDARGTQAAMPKTGDAGDRADGLACGAVGALLIAAGLFTARRARRA